MRVVEGGGWGGGGGVKGRYGHEATNPRYRKGLEVVSNLFYIDQDQHRMPAPPAITFKYITIFLK